MDERRVVIAGAGLAGLTAARELARRQVPFCLVEREAEVGGLCRSISRDGFAFDLTGHVLHTRTDEVRDLVAELLPDAWRHVERRARIHHGGVLVEYPFQVNLAPLPVEVRKECLLGFWRAQAAAPRPDPLVCSFEEWIERTFGAGIARHFMIPYNRKMWGVDLAEMSAEWTTWSVPVPTLDEVVDGALGLGRRTFGYNPSFLYPRSGGIEVLPAALAAGLPASALRRDEVESIDLADRVVALASGRRVRYGHLISTLPLTVLCQRTGGAELVREARQLRHVSVVVFNLGVRGACPVDAHWIYFAADDVAFYRVGFPSNFSDGVAPPGTYSMYVEISRESPPGDLGELRTQVLDGLERVGLLRDRGDIVTEAPVTIPHGYVIYDAHRREAVPRLLAALARDGVITTGRYGAWEYGSMETAILQGLAAARAVP